MHIYLQICHPTTSRQEQVTESVLGPSVTFSSVHLLFLFSCHILWNLCPLQKFFFFYFLSFTFSTKCSNYHQSKQDKRLLEEMVVRAPLVCTTVQSLDWVYRVWEQLSQHTAQGSGLPGTAVALCKGLQLLRNVNQGLRELRKKWVKSLQTSPNLNWMRAVLREAAKHSLRFTFLDPRESRTHINHWRLVWLLAEAPVFR